MVYNSFSGALFLMSFDCHYLRSSNTGLILLLSLVVDLKTNTKCNCMPVISMVYDFRYTNV